MGGNGKMNKVTELGMMTAASVASLSGMYDGDTLLGGSKPSINDKISRERKIAKRRAKNKMRKRSR